MVLPGEDLAIGDGFELAVVGRQLDRDDALDQLFIADAGIR